MSDAALVVGLGNPGPEYERTRHNLGFRVIDVLCARLGARLRPTKGIRGSAAEARDGERRLVLAEPLTFMNLSGEAVAAYMRYHKVGVEDVVVVHDDIDLPLGTVRVKRGGGHGGNNGVRSIVSAVGPEFARVRIGIGRPSGRKDPVDHVLDTFSKKEEQEVAIVIEEAADAVLLVVSEGVEAAQNRFNPRDAAPEPAPKQRRVRKEVVVDAPPAEVWEAWTTAEGAQTFFAPSARITPEPGGPYELAFNPAAPRGLRGSEGCEVLEVKPRSRLSFTWNAPPELAEVRDERTRVDVSLRAAGPGRTRVTLTHSGWGEGPVWDEAFAYFERAWDVVLDRLRRRFADGPIDWSEKE